MGLFDNFKLTNSTVVQQFPGSKFQELAAVKGQLDDSYLKSQELGLKIQTDAANTPFMEADKSAWQQLNMEAKQTLDSWRNRGDLENALPELYKYAGTVATKAKSLADEKKKRDAYIESLNDPKLGLTEEIKRARILEADRGYSGAKFDEYGRNVNSYNTPQVAKNVNNMEKVQQALRTITPYSNAELVDFDTLESKPGMTAYKVGNEIKYISTNTLLNQVRQAMSIDNEWANSIQQEASAKALLENETITPEVAAKYLQEAQGPEADLAREYAIKFNLSPEKAVLKAAEERHKQATISNIESFAKNHAFQQTSTTSSVGPTEGQKMEAQLNKSKELANYTAGLRAEAETEASNIIGKNSTTNVDSWAASGAEVFAKAEKVNTTNEALATKEAAANKILSNEASSVESKIQAQADLLEINQARQANTLTSKYITDVQERLKQKALDQIQPGATMATLKKQDRDARWKALTKVDLSGTGYTHEELFLAHERGEVTVNPVIQPVGRSFETGPMYPASYKGKVLPAEVGKALQVKSELGKKAENLAKTLPTKGLAITTTAIPIIKEAEVKAVKSLLKNAPVTDISNTEAVQLNPGEVDWDKTSAISWIPELNKVRATVTLSDGSIKDLMFDASGMNIHKEKGGQLTADPDPFVKAMGRAVHSERMPGYLQALNQLNGLITQHPLSPGQPIMYNNTPVGFQRLDNGSYALVNLSNNQVMKSGLSMLNVVGFLELSLGK